MVELEVDCGSGTYIRSIARDLGETLGCGGLVDVLVRTRIGPFRLEEAVAFDAIAADSVSALLRPAVEAVAGLPRKVLDPAEVADIVAGRRIAAGAELGGGPVALLDASGRLVAVGEVDVAGGQVQPRKVLVGG
jgi:tRNA pseudouridine55 synthase